MRDIQYKFIIFAQNNRFFLLQLTVVFTVQERIKTHHITIVLGCTRNDRLPPHSVHEA